MSIQSKLAFVCALLISPTAFAEDLATATDPLPPGTFTSTQHSDEWKIKNALSAGPPWITDNATVVEMGVTMSGGKHKMTERVIRPGTNGWKCMPDDDMEAFKGLNEDLSRDGQYITSLNHSKSLLWVIPVAKGGERIQAYRPTAKTSAGR